MGERPVRADVRNDGIAQYESHTSSFAATSDLTFAPSTETGLCVTSLTTPITETVGTTASVNNVTSRTLVVTEYDQPVASPGLLNNSWGGRLEMAWSF